MAVDALRMAQGHETPFPLRGENIISFSKDWDDTPTSNTHVLRVLAREGNRVLWVNSVGLRKPSLRRAHDLTRIVRKAHQACSGPVEVAPNLWVLSPLLIPAARRPALQALNATLLARVVSRARKAVGIESFQLWSFLPIPLAYLTALAPPFVVYYCVDNWPVTESGLPSSLSVNDRELAGRANIVFTTSRALWRERTAWNANTILVPHGVDHAHFARALDPALPIPPELVDLPPPIVGVIGLIDARVDLRLLEFIARRHPDWTIAIVGTVLVNVERLRRLSNVRFLGRQPYERLPQFCKAFSVGLIPFFLNEYTMAVNPIKLREYLSAGLSVVSTPLPEVSALRPLVHIAGDASTFVAAVEHAIASDSVAARQSRSAAMRSEEWGERVRTIATHVHALRHGCRSLTP